MLVKELKRRIYIILGSILLLIIQMICNREKIITEINELMGGQVVEISIIDTFKVLIELIVTLSLILSIPVILLQIYMFICQGLFKQEQQRLKRLLIVNIILWLVGIMTLKVLFLNIRDMLFMFKNVTIEEIESIDSILSSYTIIKQVLFSLLLLYEIPIFIQILIYVKLVDGLKLINNRRYYILGIVVVISAVNGVELWSNFLMIISMILIYELLIIKERIQEVGKL